MVTTNDTTKTAPDAGAIDARVVIDVDVQPSAKESTAAVRLEITARNTTSAEIPFQKPYVVPTRFAQNIKASDETGPLPHTYADNRLSIRFNERRAIPPHGAYTYKLSFDRKIETKFDRDVLIFVYRIPPQNFFQGVPVQSHEFECTFRLHPPREDTWRRLKQYRIILVDNRRAIADVTQEKDATCCKVSAFTTGPSDGETMLTFVCIYQYSRRVGHLGVAALSTILRLLFRVTIGLFFQK